MSTFRRALNDLRPSEQIQQQPNYVDRLLADVVNGGLDAKLVAMGLRAAPQADAVAQTVLAQGEGDSEKHLVGIIQPGIGTHQLLEGVMKLIGSNVKVVQGSKSSTGQLDIGGTSSWVKVEVLNNSDETFDTFYNDQPPVAIKIYRA